MKLRVEKAIYGGSGLARISADAEGDETSAGLAGKTVFVPNALPGELVEARITEDRRSFAQAEVDAVLEPAAGRTMPGCGYFPACGGCQYQHADDALQLEMKLAILRESLERAKVPAPERIEVLAGEPWQYRNRIRLHVQSSPGLALCYRERGSHTNLPVDHCPIAAPLLQECIVALTEIGKDSKLVRECEEVEFFTNAEESALLVSLFTRGTQSRSAGELQHFAEQLGWRIPALTGVGQLQTEGARSRLIAHWGERSLDYDVSGLRYRVGLGSFFQVNRFLTPALHALVMLERKGGVAWDLFAGVGLFARGLQFEQITAVESAAASLADLRHNLTGPGRRVVQATTLRFLQDFVRDQRRRGPTPELIVLDPPRAGLGKEVCALLAQVAAAEIVYVSCDPATLSRDLQALLQSGYRLQKLYLVDLFPQTYHMESVAVLLRG